MFKNITSIRLLEETLKFKPSKRTPYAQCDVFKVQ